MTMLEEVIVILDGVSGLGASKVFSPFAPNGSALPYVTVYPDVSLTPTQKGDGATTVWDHSMQVSLWEVESSEDEELLQRIIDALDGTAGTVAKKIRVVSMMRLMDDDNETVQRALTISSPIIV